MQRKILFTILLISTFCFISCRESGNASQEVRSNNDEKTVQISESVENSQKSETKDESEDFIIFDFDFFGFKMNDTQESVIERLKAQGKKIEVYENDGYYEIEPEDQDIMLGINLDYKISFFNGSVFQIQKFVEDSSYKDYLMNKLGSDSLHIDHSRDEYIWSFDNIEVKFIVDTYEPMLKVLNKKVLDEYDRHTGSL